MENNLKNAIETAIELLNKDETRYIDSSTGKSIKLEEAIKGGVAVIPVTSKKLAFDQLAGAGLDVNDNAIKKNLIELGKLLGGEQATKTKRRTRFSAEQKRALVQGFKPEEGSKKDYAEKHGVGYQSFLSWEKEFSK